MNAQEDRTQNWARLWRVAHPIVSWTLGAGLFIFATITGNNQSPEWYALIGGLIGGPFVTLWKENQKKAKP